MSQRARDNFDREELRTLRARADLRRTLGERLADQMTAIFGSTLFLLLDAVWFVVPK